MEALIRRNYLDQGATSLNEAVPFTEWVGLIRETDLRVISEASVRILSFTY